METIELILKDIKENIETLPPDTVSVYAIKLSLYYGNLGEQSARAEIEYNKKWEEIRCNVETDGRADKKSKTTEEYFVKRVLEMRIKSLKKTIDSLEKRAEILKVEMRLSGKT